MGAVLNADRPTYAAGWYPDPNGRFELRFHNGTTWTADVSNGGTRFVDPLGLAPPTPTTNPLATASLVIGIVAVMTAWLPFVVAVGLVTAPVAIGLGIAGIRRSGPSNVGRDRALAGSILGVTAFGAAIIGVLLTILVVNAYRDYTDPAAHEITVISCEIIGSRASMVGELTNLSDRDAEFSVRVGFFRTGNDDPLTTRRIEVGEVAAGDTVTFDAQRQVDMDDVDCAVVDVNGPLPFGVALD